MELCGRKVMTSQDTTHIAFSDESYWNIGRFRALGLLTLRYSDLPFLQTEAHAILDESDVTELKWTKLRTAKQRFCAVKFCQFAVDEAQSGRLRIDVLTWDIQDSRHTVRRRDDVANLQRMYYHLFKNVLRKRWPGDWVWRLCPDENTAVDWESVEDFLSAEGSKLDVRADLFAQSKFRVRLRTEFGIEKIEPRDSVQQPLVQVADLFAGLAVFSRSKYNCYEVWHRTHGPQPPLFPVNADSQVQLSGADQDRCEVLAEFEGMCKGRRLGVSLKTNRGLKTYNPRNPINFWWYEPQHDLDKAPVK